MLVRLACIDDDVLAVLGLGKKWCTHVSDLSRVGGERLWDESSSHKKPFQDSDRCRCEDEEYARKRSCRFLKRSGTSIWVYNWVGYTRS